MNFKERVLGTSLGYWSLKRVIASDRANQTIVGEYLRPEPGETILDVGCGVGDVARYIGDATYVGVDQNPSYIDRATEQSYRNATFVRASVQELPSMGFTGFDKVIIIGVLHHLDDESVSNLMAHLPSVMKPGGRLIVAENAWVPDQKTAARVWIVLDRGRHVRSISGYEQHISPHFDDVTTVVRHDLLRMPYTYVVSDATNRRSLPADNADAGELTSL